MRRIAVAQGRAATPDGVLAQEAAAGSGASYAGLYDRYETQIFNYSLRLTGSPEDAADATQEAFVGVLRRLRDDERPVLAFSSYLFAAARHESYAVMRRRARIRPTDVPPEEPGRITDIEADPERAALLQDSQEAVRAANAQLPPRYREVLALREVGERSYDEIGRIMGISANAAAQLIWRARGRLRELLTAGAVASIVASSSDCERAQLLITRRQDGEPVSEADAAWLEEHLEECRSCRTAEGMLLEVATSYRAWLPVAALAGLRMDVLAHAGELVGADWSGVAATTQRAARSGSRSVGAGAAVATMAALAVALWVLLQDDPQIEQQAAPASAPPPRAAARPPPDAAAPAPRRQVARAAAARAERPAPTPGGAPASLGAPSVTPLANGPGPTAPRPAPRGGLPRPGEPPSRPDAPRGPDAPPRQPEPPGAEMPAPPVVAPPEPSSPEPQEPPEPPPQGPPPTPPDRPAEPPPPPPEPPGCTWPGRGKGPKSCPPGHGGSPPGRRYQPP